MFTDKEKENAFDRLSARFYNRNFGTMSKTDIEILLFDIYIEHLLDNKLPFDDYTMSKALGISQSKIRNLKIRKELQYPRENFDWVAAFADDLKRASYDDENKRVKVLITDVNVLTELRYYIEKNGWFDEYQMNPKLFQCNIDFFIDIVRKLSEENLVLDQNGEKKLKQLEKDLPDGKVKSAIRNILNGCVEDGSKQLLLYAGKKVGVELLGMLPVVGQPAKNIVNALIDVLSQDS